MPTVAEIRSAVSKTRDRFSYMTDAQLTTRLNRITKVAKLMAFLQVAEETGRLNRWRRPVRNRAERLGLDWLTIAGRYGAVADDRPVGLSDVEVARARAQRDAERPVADPKPKHPPDKREGVRMIRFKKKT
jgi:hypothetical protein